MMMPLRAAMPSTVRNPINEPSEMTPPASHAARTPPTSAEGSVRKLSVARRQLSKDCRRRRKMPTSASTREQLQPLARRAQLRILALQHREVAQRECHRLQARLHVGGDRREDRVL